MNVDISLKVKLNGHLQLDVFGGVLLIVTNCFVQLRLFIVFEILQVRLSTAKGRETIPYIDAL